MISHQFWNIRHVKRVGAMFGQESLEEFSAELGVPIPCWPRDSERDRKGSTRNPVAPDHRISVHWFWWVAEPYKGDYSCAEWNDSKLKVFLHPSYKPKRQFFDERLRERQKTVFRCIGFDELLNPLREIVLTPSEMIVSWKSSFIYHTNPNVNFFVFQTKNKQKNMERK